MWVLVNQRSWRDHDHGYAGLGDLGEVALPRLLRMALAGSDDESFQ